jgi:hypothetical protein
MKMENLLEKYPSFFPPNFYFECGDGWYDILEDFFKMLKFNKLEVKMTQIKEKFGELRIYTDGCKTPLEGNMVDQLIDEAERASRNTCELCGNQGSITNRKNWYRCRCRHCNIMDKFAEVK